MATEIIIKAPDGNITITSDNDFTEEVTNKSRVLHIDAPFTIEPDIPDGMEIEPADGKEHVDVTVNGKECYGNTVTVNAVRDNHIVVSLN